MSPRGATFELARFELTPVTADVALLEVEGLLERAPARTRSPRLLVEARSGVRREHAPVEATLQDGQLRASFTVSAADLPGGELALAVGGLLLDLPDPDPVPGADRTVALARELNVLRQEMTTLRDEAGAIREAAAERELQDERARQAAEERTAELDRAAEERAAEAERRAEERVAQAERAASERQAELLRATAKRQGELERMAAELQEAMAAATADADRRDGAAAAEHARLASERDDAWEEQEAAAERAEAEAERAAAEARAHAAARAELEELRRTFAARPAKDDTTAVFRATDATPTDPADPDTTVALHEDPSGEHGDPADGDEPPLDEDDTAERPAEDRDAAGEAEPEDTGPIPLRRGVPRGATRAVPPPAAVVAPHRDAGPLARFSPRTLALAAVGVAGLLVLIAILGVAL